MSPPARTHCQLVRLAFRAVAPGGGPVRRRLSCRGRSRLATLQLRRRGGRAERRGQVEEGSGAFPRGHAAGGQGTRGQQGWPQGGGPWARGTVSAFVVPLGSLPEPDWGGRGAPRTHLRSSGAPVSTATLLLSVLRSSAGSSAPSRLNPPLRHRGPRASARGSVARPPEGHADHADRFPGPRSLSPTSQTAGRRAAGGRRGGQPRCWAGRLWERPSQAHEALQGGGFRVQGPGSPACC